jgi:hypothetical protein
MNYEGRRISPLKPTKNEPFLIRAVIQAKTAATINPPPASASSGSVFAMNAANADLANVPFMAKVLEWNCNYPHATSDTSLLRLIQKKHKLTANLLQQIFSLTYFLACITQCKQGKWVYFHYCTQFL